MPENMGFPTLPPAQKQPLYEKLLGALLGQGPNSELLTQEQQKALRQQQLMALSASLLQAGGPSPVRTSLGQAIGQGLMSAQQAGQQGTNDALSAMLLKSQIQRNEQRQQGASPAKVQEFEYAKANGFNGSFEDYLRIGSAQPQKPAGIQEYEYFNTLSPEAKKEFLSLQRSPVVPQLAVVNGVPTLVDRTNASQTPLSTQASEIEAATKRSEAQAAGTASGQITGAREGKRGPAYAAFQTGIASLESAMGNTATGPLAGRLPALTAAQQTAEGAEATMAPILKQLFRDSGEGTFTDSDQALLMKMVPTRRDHPEARKAKIEMIDNIVRAKLAIGDEPVTPATIGVGQSTEINGVRVKRVK
jgi:hypothetical protein